MVAQNNMYRFFQHFDRYFACVRYGVGMLVGSLLNKNQIYAILDLVQISIPMVNKRFHFSCFVICIFMNDSYLARLH